MTHITEIAPDVFRITTFVEAANLQFSQFLVRDEEPLLFHTGLRALFPAVKDAVASLVDLARCAGSASAISRRTNAGPCRSGRRWRRGRTPWATCLERRRTMRGRWRGWAGLRVLEGHARARLS